MIDDDDIGPINGHSKSEALPVGCFWLVLIGLCFIAMFAAYGWSQS